MSQRHGKIISKNRKWKPQPWKYFLLLAPSMSAPSHRLGKAKPQQKAIKVSGISHTEWVFQETVITFTQTVVFPLYWGYTSTSARSGGHVTDKHSLAHAQWLWKWSTVWVLFFLPPTTIMMTNRPIKAFVKWHLTFKVHQIHLHVNIIQRHHGKILMHGLRFCKQMQSKVICMQLNCHWYSHMDVFFLSCTSRGQCKNGDRTTVWGPVRNTHTSEKEVFMAK